MSELQLYEGKGCSYIFGDMNSDLVVVGLLAVVMSLGVYFFLTLDINLLKLFLILLINSDAYYYIIIITAVLYLF